MSSLNDKSPLIFPPSLSSKVIMMYLYHNLVPKSASTRFDTTSPAYACFDFITCKLELSEDNTLRKHAYSNIVKISPPKPENFQIKIL